MDDRAHTLFATTTRSITLAALATFALLLALRGSSLASACGEAAASFASGGPYGVGQRTLTLVDQSRDTPAYGSHPAHPGRTLVTEVWYPTAAAPGTTPERDAPAAGGRFALVVDAHGFGDYRETRAYYATALASRATWSRRPTSPSPARARARRTTSIPRTSRAT